jgi:GT2 family glycosyltransferase
MLLSLGNSLHSLDHEILVSSEGSKSFCRNELAKKAKGEILVFFDDDVEIRENTISELLMPFDTFKNVGVVGGVNVTFPDASSSEKLSGRLLSLPFVTFKSSSRYTPKGTPRETDESEIQSCVMAVSKEAFVKAGGFPLDIIPAEENALVNSIQKLGYKVIYNPFAIVYHRRPKLYREYARTMFNYAYGRGLLIRKHKGSLKMFHKPSKDWLKLTLGVIVHYVSYISGLIWGWLRG